MIPDAPSGSTPSHTLRRLAPDNSWQTACEDSNTPNLAFPDWYPSATGRLVDARTPPHLVTHKYHVQMLESKEYSGSRPFKRITAANVRTYCSVASSTIPGVIQFVTVKRHLSETLVIAIPRTTRAIFSTIRILAADIPVFLAVLAYAILPYDTCDTYFCFVFAFSQKLSSH